jgi:broad specificity phosphatase PhoE
MMTTLYLIRHGEVQNPLNLTYGRVRYIDLTVRGKLQIHSLAESIKERSETPIAIFSSPLKRTVQSTEQILSVFPDTPVYYRDELKESDSTGYVGRPLDWARGLGNPYNKAYAKQFHYTIESEEIQVERMLKIVKEAVDTYAGSIVCLVSHGDPLAFLVDGLHHGGKHTTTIDILKKDTYLLRGEAWRVVLDDELKLIETERITPTVQDHSQTER